MSFFKSIQFKAMLCMMVVAAVSVLVIDQVYQAWLVEAEELAIQGRLKKSLFSMGLVPENQRQAFDRLIQLSRRFDLDGAAYIVRDQRRIIASIGRQLKPERLRKILDLKQGKDTFVILPAAREGNILWGVRTIATESPKRYMLAVAISRAHGLVTRESLSSISWITLIGCVFVALFFSYLLRNTVTRPLKRLSQSMIKVAHGDLSQHMSIDVDYELRVLVIEFNRMIDELRDNRHKVQDYQEKLEQRIEEIRQELARKEADLIQAEKLASVGQLAAGVAHEINNPIYHIMLTADLLAKTVQDEKGRKRVEQISSQARRCRGIVSDLLEHSRQGPPLAENFGLHDIVHAAVAQLSEHKTFADIAFEVKVPRDAPQIRGIRDEIRRVMDIILLNSAQAIAGKGKITIATKIPQPTEIELVIIDNGHGMKPEVRSRAFEPFFSTKKVGQGTGLGLSIAYGIITRHHGKISLHSEQAKGTQVRIVFPIQEDEKEDAKCWVNGGQKADGDELANEIYKEIDKAPEKKEVKKSGVNGLLDGL